MVRAVATLLLEENLLQTQHLKRKINIQSLKLKNARAVHWLDFNGLKSKGLKDSRENREQQYWKLKKVNISDQD